jgi:hypothetical protein
VALQLVYEYEDGRKSFHAHSLTHVNVFPFRCAVFGGLRKMQIVALQSDTICQHSKSRLLQKPTLT